MSMEQKTVFQPHREISYCQAILLEAEVFEWDDDDNDWWWWLMMMIIFFTVSMWRNRYINVTHFIPDFNQTAKIENSPISLSPFQASCSNTGFVFLLLSTSKQSLLSPYIT